MLKTTQRLTTLRKSAPSLHDERHEYKSRQLKLRTQILTTCSSAFVSMVLEDAFETARLLGLFAIREALGIPPERVPNSVTYAAAGVIGGASTLALLFASRRVWFSILSLSPPLPPPSPRFSFFSHNESCVAQLRRYRTVADIPPDAFAKQREIRGLVVRVPDGDNFRMLHVPALSWLRFGSPLSLFNRGALKRSVLSQGQGAASDEQSGPPMLGKKLSDITLSIRLSSVDAPEHGWFGKETQPYAKEAREWLES